MCLPHRSLKERVYASVETNMSWWMAEIIPVIAKIVAFLRFPLNMLRQYLIELRRARQSELIRSKHTELKSIHRYRTSIRTIYECITKVSGKRLIINTIDVNIRKRTSIKQCCVTASVFRKSDATKVTRGIKLIPPLAG